ncbi:acetyltransferase [Arthrobacter sp. ZBG10]|uniref:GNAT family N-acetyltransferase n=1 Tax=Micrococcaceae TaxID=1268 RepID=UPI000680EAED|nr:MULTISPECIES: GNAT family N-acetyltransferase [Micrococcaceae]KNH15173.1 acetyltransferase [Arthrobacter sp. ZBG10]KQQ98795.1 acetyltransferase [Arthrobacter sp. Leaf141]
MSNSSDNYEIRRFPAATEGSEGFDQSLAWSRAVAFGFHDEARTTEHITGTLAIKVADQPEYTGVYQVGDVPASSLPAEVPVATFGTFRKTLNIGFGRTLPSHLITAVTVRTTHRRRGLLRRMMAEDLRLAKDSGVSMAALTASEGTIYGRFGFGVASFERSVKVDTTARFSLAHQATGTVEIADPRKLLDLAPEVFEQVHRLLPGSVGRHEWYRHMVSGARGRDGKEDAAIKVALHYGPAGAVDGYVSYKFLGWEKEPYTVEVVDFLAASDDAYLELWQFLGAIDLVERVTWDEAPLDDPLTWALADPRCIDASDVRDMLWLRILDVPAALTARHYPVDGRLVINVGDPLGLAGGTFAVTVEGGQADVERLAEETPADLDLDVSVLSSIYLGAVSPVTLAAAGRIREHTQGAALQARGMFAVERSTHCLTHF